MKKFIRNIILIGIAVLAAFQIMRMTSRITQKDMETALVNANPSMTVYALSGDTADIRQLGGNHASLVMYFSPDCDHCQNEAKTLRKHLPDFGQIEIIMLSMQDATETRAFAREYHLDSLPNVHFYLDKAHQFPLLFGTRGFPIILLYSDTHHLVRLFKGETRPDRLTAALRKL